MRKKKISTALFSVVLLIFILNAVISIFNVVEDGTLVRRVIPAVCWTIAAVLWTISYLRKSGDGN